jgi:hypothetical protein
MTLTPETTANCPMCGRPGIAAGDLFRCPAGCGFFDSDPDEGSPETYDDPVRSLEAKERRQKWRRRPR